MDAAMPGSEIARPSDRTYRKRADGEWEALDRDGHPTRMYYQSTAFSLGGGSWRWQVHIPAFIEPAEVEAMRVRVRQVIDDCVRQQSPHHGEARDGAWMRLGLMPLPEVGDTVAGRSAFGLPVGSVIRQNNHLYYIHEQERRPQELRIHGITREARAFALEGTAQVVTLEPMPEVRFYSADDLLNKVWQEYWPLKQLHSWCSFVENCLQAAGLSDPGPQPQELPAVAAAIEIPPLEVGSVFQSSDVATKNAYKEALRTLPLGSLLLGVRTGRLLLRTDASETGWVRTDTLSPAMRSGQPASEMDVRILSIPGVTE
jgi:hypothetical protein